MMLKLVSWFFQSIEFVLTRGIWLGIGSPCDAESAY